MKLKKIYYINLHNRKDRLFFAQQQLKQGSIPTERIEAVQHSDGRIGCALSHLKTLYKIYELKEDGYYMILEDDFFMTMDIDYEHEINVLESHNARFYCFSHTYPSMSTIANTDYVQLKKSFSTCAYLFHYSMIPIFIYQFEKAIRDRKPIDLQWHAIQDEFFCLAKKNPQILQLPSFSDITNNNTFYQNHAYFLLDPNRYSFGAFLFQFVNALVLSFRHRRFLFVKHWQDYDKMFTMSFYPPKSLSSAETVSDPEFTRYDAGKNYVLNIPCQDSVIDESVLYDFRYLLKTEPCREAELQIGILHHPVKKTNTYTELENTLYYEQAETMLRKKYPQSSIHVFTTNESVAKTKFSNVKIIPRSEKEILQHSINYDVLVIGNNALSWWIARLHHKPNPQIYYPSLVYQKRKPSTWKYLSDWNCIHCASYTMVLFDMSEKTYSDHALLDVNVPVILYTTVDKEKRYLHVYEHAPNIEIHVLEKSKCHLFSKFPNESELLLFHSEKIHQWYHVANRNPFNTPCFILSTLDDTHYTPLCHYDKLIPRLDKKNIMKVTEMAKQKNISISFGTKESISRYHKSYYKEKSKQESLSTCETFVYEKPVVAAPSYYYTTILVFSIIFLVLFCFPLLS